MRTSLAVLLLAFSAAAPAQQLGTLFHTPKEREALDRMRRGEPVDPVSAPSADPVVTGFVKRSDGKSTVFIDKRPYPARDARMQGVLEPRIVERYEPIPIPAPPAAPAGADAAGSTKAGPDRKDAVAPPKGGKEE